MTKRFDWQQDGADFRAKMPGNVTLVVTADRKRDFGTKATRGTGWHAQASQWDGASTFSRFGRDEYGTLHKSAKEAMRAAEAIYSDLLRRVESSAMTNQPYTIEPARYSKGNLIVRCLDGRDGMKGRASYLIGDMLNCKYVGRSRGYVASPSKVAIFEELYAQGWNATCFGEALAPPDVIFYLAMALAAQQAA